jgi:hypothetical protein
MANRVGEFRDLIGHSGTKLSAWGDESGSNQRRDPNVYIMGVIVLPVDREDEVRDNLRAIQKRRGEKLHWTREPEKRKDAIAEAVANSGIVGVAYVKVTETGEPNERMRHKCLLSLMPNLWVEYDCWDLTLESRGPKQDKQDMKMLAALRSQKRITPEFRLSHAIGLVEPLLWAADTICGAVVSARLGESRWLRLINAEVKMVGIDVIQY